MKADPGPQFRLATPEDAGWITALVHQHANAAIDPENTDDFDKFLNSISENAERRYIESEDHTVIVATVDEIPSGFIGVRKPGHIFHCFVYQSAQRQGIGRGLWLYYLENFSGNMTPPVYTVNSALGAVDFYHKLGFRQSQVKQSRHGICFVPMMLEPAAQSSTACTIGNTTS